MNENNKTCIMGKMVVLGDQVVGKTSIITRYVTGRFDMFIAPTCGASFFTCKLTVKNTDVKLQIWDTAGQERFKAMAPLFYRNASAAMLVFDVTEPSSFENVKKWVAELRRHVEAYMILCVVANKIDLKHSRKITTEEGLHYAQNIGACYIESSALTDEGVQDIFSEIALGFVKMAEGKGEHFLKIYRETEDGNMTSVTHTVAARNDTIRLTTQNGKPKSWWRRRC